VQFTCIRCGSDVFKAGEVQPAMQGGYFLILPCAECDYANVAFHDMDEEYMETLQQFFEAKT
jgi:hypothetical protein